MPYIPQSRRGRLSSGALKPVTPGELNYLITCEIVKADQGDVPAEILQDEVQYWVDQYLKENKPLRYQVINDVAGALRCATFEYICRSNKDQEVRGVLASVSAAFYAKVAIPYEEQKRHENGDVY